MKRVVGSAAESVTPSGSGIGLPASAGSEPRAQGPRGDLWVVVLAGGNGTRLQAFTRDILGTERPKQFCRIIGTRSMLRHTWDRALRMVPPERILTIITAGQERYLEEEAAGGRASFDRLRPGARVRLNFRRISTENEAISVEILRGPSG